MSVKVVEEYLRELESLQPDEPVMFGGSITMEREVYDFLYAPLVKKVIDKQGQIVVGCADGCDSFVQQQCVDAGYSNVCVFVPSEAKAVAYLSEKFEKIVVPGGFKKRDRAMQERCKRFCGFYSQYAGAASGTAANDLAIAAKNGVFGKECVNLDGYAVVDFLRKHSLPFDDSLAAYVQKAEASKLTPKETK